MRGRRDATRALHAGLTDRQTGDRLLPGPVVASLFELAGEAGRELAGQHGASPAQSACEHAVAELEQAEALLFSSGMAAASAVLLSHVGVGDRLVMPADGFGVVRQMTREHFEPRGVELREVPTDTDAIVDACEGATVVWIETPSNPGLEVCDIRAVAEAAHAAGALVVADNTLATPLGQRVLDLGADVAVTSAAEVLTGHADLVLGAVTTRDPQIAAVLRHWRGTTGAVAGPFVAWFAHRSLLTLELRLERQCANARALADFLADRDELEEVRYPGRPEDPAHRVAARQMDRFGPVVGLRFAGAERAEAFLGGCRLVAAAPSFGGIHTTAGRCARWESDDADDGFVRLSAGCEDIADLTLDLARALDRLD